MLIENTDKEMMFVVYRLNPMRIFSIHRNYMNASNEKQKILEDGDEHLNVEIYGLYVRD